MTREINLGQNVTVVTKEEVVTNKVDNWLLTLDDGGCALCSYTVGGVTHSDITLWDAQTTPSYEEVGQYTDEDIENRIKGLILNP